MASGAKSIAQETVAVGAAEECGMDNPHPTPAVSPKPAPLWEKPADELKRAAIRAKIVPA